MKKKFRKFSIPLEKKIKLLPMIVGMRNAKLESHVKTQIVGTME